MLYHNLAEYIGTPIIIAINIANIETMTPNTRDHIRLRAFVSGSSLYINDGLQINTSIVTNKNNTMYTIYFEYHFCTEGVFITEVVEKLVFIGGLIEDICALRSVTDRSNSSILACKISRLYL